MINFGNKLLPNFVKVTAIRYSILPVLEHKTKKVYGQYGSHDFGMEVGMREIEVDIMILANNQYDILPKARQVAQILFKQDLQPLIILDEPDKVYQARLSGDSKVSELYTTGTATLKFVCPSPFAESKAAKTLKWSPVDYTPINVKNNGTVETHAVFDLKIKEDTPSIVLMKDDKYVKIGDNDGDKKPVALKSTVFSDVFATNYAYGSGIAVDGGIIAGSLKSNGYNLMQQGADFGENKSGWHGGASTATLSRQLQDFRVEANIRQKSTAAKQIGRIEIYLLDANNVTFGKIAFVDNDPDMDKPRFEARHGGTTATANYFLNTHGAYKGVFKDFDGYIKIQRSGKVWKAFVGKVDAKGKAHTRASAQWIDSKGLYANKKLAKIQLHIGANKEYVPVSTMYFKDFKVIELNGNVNNDTEVPIIFKSGDTVTIDNQSATVLLNGDPIFTELDAASDFFPLDVGDNGLILSPPVADVDITYKEKWL